MKKILVIDDSEMIRQTIKRQLEKRKCEFTGVESGRVALELLQVSNFDLVLLDQMMPEMNGIETFRQIREKFESYPPVIMITAFSSMELAVTFMRDGGSDFIAKPLDFDVLEIKIRQAISKAELKKDNAQLKELHMQKSQFISNVSHELRTPLTSIKSMTEILLDEPNWFKGEKAMNSLALMNKETDRLSQLIGRLLHFRDSEDELLADMNRKESTG